MMTFLDTRLRSEVEDKGGRKTGDEVRGLSERRGKIGGGEVSSEVGFQDGSRKISVCLVDRGKWSVRTVTVKVWKVRSGGGVVVVGG